MIAITGSAWITPSSISLVSSEASETEWIVTLRSSMALGIRRSKQMRASAGYDDGAGRADVGDRVDDPVEAGDDPRQVGALDEPAHRVDLRPHRPAGEVPLLGVALHLRQGHLPDRLGLRSAEAQHRLRHVGGHDQQV